MKRPIMSAISKLTLGVVLFACVSSANAQTSYVSTVEKNAQVKYIGNSDDAVVFDVSYSNPKGSKFVVTVQDEDGIAMYEAAFSDKQFDKKFRLPKSDKNKLTFIIRNYKDLELKQTFEINTRMVEDVTVTKI